MWLGRRGFIKKIILGFIGLCAIDAYWLEKYFIDWETFDLAVDDTDKIKAVQISDLHLREIKPFHKSIAERINQEQPDVLFITGDSITHNKRLPLFDDFLTLIDHKIKKIGILGNKEYSGRINLRLFQKMFEKHNGTLLINETYELSGKNRKINIVGIDDLVWGRPNFGKAIEQVDKSLPTIVLNHCPAYRKEIDKSSNAFKQKLLILSGHTHGGQITFFGIPLYTPYGSGEYVKGWYNGHISNMHVTKGIGTTVLPFRFGARAEANIFYF